jgi:hypothetical protein
VTEHVVVSTGELTVGPPGAERTAGPGEHVEWDASVPHRYAAGPAADVHATLLIRYPRPGGSPPAPPGGERRAERGSVS